MSWIYATYQHAQCIDLATGKVLLSSPQLHGLKPCCFCSFNICNDTVADVQDAIRRQPQLAGGVLKNDRGRFAIANVAGHDYCLDVWLKAALAQKGSEALVPIGNHAAVQLVRPAGIQSRKDTVKNDRRP